MKTHWVLLTEIVAKIYSVVVVFLVVFSFWGCQTAPPAPEPDNKKDTDKTFIPHPLSGKECLNIYERGEYYNDQYKTQPVNNFDYLYRAKNEFLIVLNRCKDTPDERRAMISVALSYLFLGEYDSAKKYFKEHAQVAQFGNLSSSYKTYVMLDKCQSDKQLESYRRGTLHAFRFETSEARKLLRKSARSKCVELKKLSNDMLDSMKNSK